RTRELLGALGAGATGAALSYGEANVSWATVGMKKVRFHSLDSIGYKALDLPRHTLETVSLWFAPPAAVRAVVKRAGHAPGEALSGVRNVLVTLMPLFAMCDPS